MGPKPDVFGHAQITVSGPKTALAAAYPHARIAASGTAIVQPKIYAIAADYVHPTKHAVAADGLHTIRTNGPATTLESAPAGPKSAALKNLARGYFCLELAYAHHRFYLMV